MRRLEEVMGGMTPGEFAKKIGGSTSAVYLYLKGRIPDRDALARISQATGRSVSWLLEGEESRAETSTSKYEGVVERFAMAFMQLDVEDRTVLLEVERMLLEGPKELREKIKDYIATLRLAYPPKRKGRLRRSRKSIGYLQTKED